MTDERRLTLIGIGAGDPRQLTIEAVDAMGATDVFVVLDKGPGKEPLEDVRRALIERHGGAAARVVEIPDPVRDRDGDYVEGVARWHAQRAERLERALVKETGAAEQVSLLVWGDPSLYDSTLRLIETVAGRGHVRLEHRVIPGLSSVQLLAARHGIVLHDIGGSVLITTGRRLAVDGMPAEVDDVVVMLDGESAYLALVGEGLHVYWGAYLGMPEELLVAGPLEEVAGRIAELRAEANAEHGWVFDIYLLRRRATR